MPRLMPREINKCIECPYLEISIIPTPYLHREVSFWCKLLYLRSNEYREIDRGFAIGMIDSHCPLEYTEPFVKIPDGSRRLEID